MTPFLNLKQKSVVVVLGFFGGVWNDLFLLNLLKKVSIIPVREEKASTATVLFLVNT